MWNFISKIATIKFSCLKNQEQKDALEMSNKSFKLHNIISIVNSILAATLFITAIYSFINKINIFYNPIFILALLIGFILKIVNTYISATIDKYKAMADDMRYEIGDFAKLNQRNYYKRISHGAFNAIFTSCHCELFLCHFPILFNNKLGIPEHSPIALFGNGLLTVLLQSYFSRKINFNDQTSGMGCPYIGYWNYRSLVYHLTLSFCIFRLCLPRHFYRH